jgi:hypothetical protein
LGVRMGPGAPKPEERVSPGAYSLVFVSSFLWARQWQIDI